MFDYYLDLQSRMYPAWRFFLGFGIEINLAVVFDNRYHGTDYIQMFLARFQLLCSKG